MTEMGFPKQKPTSVRKSQDVPSSEARLYQFRPELSAKQSLNRKCIALFLSLCLFHPAFCPCEPDSTRARVHAAKIVCRSNFSGFCLNLPHWLMELTFKDSFSYCFCQITACKDILPIVNALQSASMGLSGIRTTLTVDVLKHHSTIMSRHLLGLSKIQEQFLTPEYLKNSLVFLYVTP